MEDRPISVAGLGNVLMGDDALGPRAVREFEARYEVPPGVSIDDLGTPGLDLYPHLAGRSAVILVDTVRADGRAGEVRLYREDDLLRHAPAQRTSPHDPGVKETLAALRFSGERPDSFLFVGVLPERVDYVTGLSPAVEAALPAVLKAIVEELGRLGRRPRRRAAPAPLDLWWERHAVETSRAPC